MLVTKIARVEKPNINSYAIAPRLSKEGLDIEISKRDSHITLDSIIFGASATIGGMAPYSLLTMPNISNTSDAFLGGLTLMCLIGIYASAKDGHAQIKERSNYSKQRADLMRQNS